MPTTLVVVPAYRRDYTSGKAAQADWDAGKDFRNMTIGVSGTYVSNRDLPLLREGGVKWVNIRYKNQTLVKVITIK